jgi:hypothetical protein
MKEILQLVDNKPLSGVDIQPLIDKYSAGMDIHQQREVRRAFVDILEQLRNNEDIDYVHSAISQLLTISAGEFSYDAAPIFGTMKRVEKLQSSNNTNHHISIGGNLVGNLAVGNAAPTVQSFLADHLPADTPTQKTSKQRTISKILSWITANIVKIAIGVITAGIIYYLGWKK